MIVESAINVSRFFRIRKRDCSQNAADIRMAMVLVQLNNSISFYHLVRWEIQKESLDQIIIIILNSEQILNFRLTRIYSLDMRRLGSAQSTAHAESQTFRPLPESDLHLGVRSSREGVVTC